MKEIIFMNNNSADEKKSDIEWIEEFLDFLSGKMPGGITLDESAKPKLTIEQAFNVIWYLQEYFPILPNRYEKCTACDCIYDSANEGYYDEKEGAFYCDNCRCYAEKKEG